MPGKLFSNQLDEWLKSSQDKTIHGLTQVFGEKSFAIAILILMFLPTLPIPTAGVSHVLEIIAMLVSLEIIIGRRSVWVPKRWRNKHLPKAIETRFAPLVVTRVRWFERFSKPRLGRLINHPLALRLVDFWSMLMAGDKPSI